MLLRSAIVLRPPPQALPCSSSSHRRIPLRFRPNAAVPWSEQRPACPTHFSFSQVHSYGTVNYERRPSSLYRRISTMKDPGLGAGVALEPWGAKDKRLAKWEICRVAKEHRYKRALESKKVKCSMALESNYHANCMVEEFEDASESINRRTKVSSNVTISLAKRLACLPDESLASDVKRPLNRFEHKRLIEFRIKKKVKAQYSNGKYLDLMSKVVAKADTLSDVYDIIRLNSNVILTSKKDDICFSSLAEQIENGQFDVVSNTSSIQGKRKHKECLVLPKLKLKIVQEAMRLVLEVVYRPHFSRISHGCRSGRGQRSALNYLSNEIGNHNWWFTLFINKEADKYILSKLISEMNDKIEDSKLFSFIQSMFDAGVLSLVFGSFPNGHGLPQEGVCHLF